MSSDLNWRYVLPTLYPEGVVPLEDVHSHFGLSLDAAKQAALRNELPVPAMRLGSRKSPWVIHLDEFTALIDSRASLARQHWEKLNAVA